MTNARRSRARFARRLSWLVVAALMVAAIAPVPALAAENANDLQVVQGTPECDAQHSNTVDPPAGGVQGPVNITNLTSTSFDWALTESGVHDFDMAAVIVQAEGVANVYFYNDNTDDADTNLVSPAQTEIESITFCYNDKAEPEPTPPTSEPTPPTSEPTPPTSAPTPSGEVAGAILINKVDNNGTPDDFSDDTDLDGATFEVWRSDGDDSFDEALDTLVLEATPADGGFLLTDVLEPGDYWIVEIKVPDGFVGSGPILVTLNTDESQDCFWDSTGSLGCEEGEGATIVVVDNTPRDEGGVGGATATPRARVTLPPTDALATSDDAGTSMDGWRLVFLAMAGILGGALILTPAESRIRSNRR